jgi:rhodanese-related sulfurtransferase/glyoxylase-like metal-dependent hydrolase (beta-lactamase superfamily II)
MGAGIKDSESASHSDEAAKYIIEATYSGNGFKITQFKLGVLAHFSYIVESDGKALMVDPGRDIATYLEYAKRNNLEWVGTFLTHSHADFVAGHREMTHATGAPIYVSHLSGDLFPHIAVKDDEEIGFGKVSVRVLETPGHTPDGLCVLISSLQGEKYLLSGDTLFVGSVGRPDLMGGSYSAAELAGMIFDTWNNKLKKLDDSVVVLPAHGAGSLCGAKLGNSPSTTIGREKASNPYLKLANNRSAFIAAVLTDLGEAPAYFKENAAMNKRGPELVDWNNPLRQKFEDAKFLVMKKDVYIIDVRDSSEYAAGHIPGSVNVMLRGRIETWVGTIVPFYAKVVLRGSETEVLEACRRLKRVGYDADYFDFGARFDDIATTMIEPEELNQKMKNANAPVVVDVRLAKEWREMRIGEVLNLPLNQLQNLANSRLNPADEIVAVCNSAFRSSLAIGLLEKAGFRKVSSMNGGVEAWVEKGFPVVKVESEIVSEEISEASSGKIEFRDLGLPELMSAAELLAKQKDLPGTLEIIDVRPTDQYKSYNPLKAISVAIPELLESDKFLAGQVPLVVTDRDGTVALMVAAILSRRTRRPIKVLRGGIEEVWRETEGVFFTPGPIKRREEQKNFEKQEKPDLPPSRPEPVKTDKKRNAGC